MSDCHAQLNEAGNFLIEVTETATSLILAEQLSKVNMQWADCMKKRVFVSMLTDFILIFFKIFYLSYRTNISVLGSTIRAQCWCFVSSNGAFTYPGDQFAHETATGGGFSPTEG